MSLLPAKVHREDRTEFVGHIPSSPDEWLGGTKTSTRRSPIAPQTTEPKTISPSREQITIHAYHRWLGRGKPIGTDGEDWFAAERQLAATA